MTDNNQKRNRLQTEKGEVEKAWRRYIRKLHKEHNQPRKPP